MNYKLHLDAAHNLTNREMKTYSRCEISYCLKNAAGICSDDAIDTLETAGQIIGELIRTYRTPCQRSGDKGKKNSQDVEP